MSEDTNTHEELRTRKLVIEDDQGRDRIMVGVDNDENTAGMYLLGTDGQPRVGVLADDEASAVELRAPDGKSVMLSNFDDIPQLIITDADGVHRLRVVLTPMGPYVELCDGQGRTRSVLSAGGEFGDIAKLELNDGDEQPVFMFGAQAVGDGAYMAGWPEAINKRIYGEEGPA